MMTINIIEPLSMRLTTAMSIRDVRAVDLCNATGIGKSAISHYMNGTNKPKQDRVYLLSKALNVRPEWLMGFDVPMEVEDFEMAKQKHDLRVARYAALFANLSDADREFIFKQIDILGKATNESK